MAKSITILQNKLLRILQTEIPNLLAVYRFGSWGTADERPDSDIDLAFLAEAPLESIQRWDLAQRLAAQAGRNVDLVDLRSASTVIQMQVVSQGEKIYYSEEITVAKFEDFIFSSYARLNIERREILADVRNQGTVYGK